MNLPRELLRDNLKRAINKLGLEGAEQAIDSLVECKLKDEFRKEFNKMVRK